MVITQTNTRFDAVKWVVITLLIAGGIWANYYYSEIEWALRLIGWIVLMGIVLGIASQTYGGRKAWEFAKGSRIELRKVVWPTRQETVRTTMVITVMVVIMALILWGIDSFLLWIMSLLTGHY